MTYYDDLARASDRARRVGWESLEAQARRYAWVASFIDPDASVLDLGAGLADLGTYLRDHGHRGRYLGLERDPSLLTAGTASAGDLFTTDERADVVVAIGVLVDGTSLRSDGTRFGRLRKILDVVRAQSDRLGLLVIAKQEAIEASPTLRLDDALGGMRQAELAWLAPDAERVDLSEVDWGVVLRRRP